MHWPCRLQLRRAHKRGIGRVDGEEAGECEARLAALMVVAEARALTAVEQYNRRVVAVDKSVDTRLEGS